MYLEIFGAVLILIGVMLFFAETRKWPLGLVASVFLLIFSFWVMFDGIQMQVGHITNVSTNSTTDGNSTSVIELKNMTYTYQEIPALPFITLSNLLALPTTLLSLYLFYFYAVQR